MCPSETTALMEYVAGTLEPAEAMAVEEHVAGCARCRQQLEAQREVWGAMEEWTPEPVSTGFDKLLYARIEQEPRGGWWRQLFRPVLPFSLQPVAVAAMVCLVIAAVSLVRAPANVEPANAAAVEVLDVEQLEQAADDLELLRVLAPELWADEENPGAL